MSEKNKPSHIIWDVTKSVSLVLGIIIGFFTLQNHLDTTIENKITDSDYIETLSYSLRPFLIFDQNEITLYDHGAKAYIDSIKVFSINPTHLTKIVIYPNRYFQIAPLLESLGPDIYYSTSERGTNNIWVYNMQPPGFSAGDLPPNKFRLELLK